MSDFIETNFHRQVDLLKALVRVPSDNPPGNCAPHAQAAQALLEKLGFKVEVHQVPDALTKKHGMASVTNLVVRERFGPGPVIALNAHGDVVPPGQGWSARSLRRGRARRAQSTAVAPRYRSRIFPPMRSRCWR